MASGSCPQECSLADPDAGCSYGTCDWAGGRGICVCDASAILQQHDNVAPFFGDEKSCFYELGKTHIIYTILAVTSGMLFLMCAVSAALKIALGNSSKASRRKRRGMSYSERRLLVTVAIALAGFATGMLNLSGYYVGVSVASTIAYCLLLTFHVVVHSVSLTISLVTRIRVTETVHTLEMLRRIRRIQTYFFVEVCASLIANITAVVYPLSDPDKSYECVMVHAIIISLHFLLVGFSTSAVLVIAIGHLDALAAAQGTMSANVERLKWIRWQLVKSALRHFFMAGLVGFTVLMFAVIPCLVEYFGDLIGVTLSLGNFGNVHVPLAVIKRDLARWRGEENSPGAGRWRGGLVEQQQQQPEEQRIAANRGEVDDTKGVSKEQQQNLQVTGIENGEVRE